MRFDDKELLRMADEGVDLPEPRYCEEHGYELNARGICKECEYEGACDAAYDAWNEEGRSGSLITPRRRE